MALDIRSYNTERDFDACVRIWHETRWLNDTPEHRAALGHMLTDGQTEVGLMDGQAECLVHRTSGTIQYDESRSSTRLPLCAITAVTTSQIARKQGFASTMTARALQQAADAGAAVGALGMFEQGFYDRFGFGTASYLNMVTFDPQSLRVSHIRYRAPIRLGIDDSSEMQAALSARLGHHGAIFLDAKNTIRADFGVEDHTFALGYRDGDGVLTHFVQGVLETENGPFRVGAIAYRSGAQLLELLRLLRELGDQLHSVRMAEPADVQFQVLLDTPIRERNRSIKSEFETISRAHAWWQFRVLDVPACVAARHWVGEPVRFNLALTDPITEHLTGAAGGWQGTGGDYTITVAGESSATAEHTEGLPVLDCDVGAFSRLWFGVATASSLRLTDRLDAPDKLCVALDEALRLPPVIPGLWF